MKFSLAILLTAFSVSHVFGQQETFRDADSLLRAISKANTDTARILSKCRLGEAYRASKPDTSFILANEALAESVKIDFDLGQIHSFLVLSVLHREKGDLAPALEYGLKALKIAEENKYHYQEIYSNIRVANIYLAVKDVPTAIIYLDKAEALLKIAYDDFQWQAVHFFKADAYEQLNELDLAERHLQMMEQKFGTDPLMMIGIIRARGNIAAKKNERARAIEYYRESALIAIREKEYRSAATAVNSMAFVFKKLGQPDSATFYAKEGLRYGQMLDYKNRVLAASSLLAELYEDRDPQEAIKYYKIASETKDSLYGVQKLMQLQSTTIKEQERRTEIEAARLAYQNRVRQYTFLAGAGVFLIIAVILYRNNRQKQKTNRLLENTLTNLKNTQSQLIQSEKMASLGELTAGIAHEIQNPLNFVNNFSELNKELLGEMKGEIGKGNIEEVNLIANDIEANEEKINHHGKRADAIVKSMLQHSQTGSGKKEPTDINALTDEYLRLAYHGLRAKEKSFNASLKTDFDESIGNINIIQQDIGRVILNLINNAFYAVDEKKKRAGNGYEPTATVTTKKQNGKIEIKVKDNGNGIPQKVLDKIFQPFFTTKPTGQGTGLGLSLAYDIVTKGHGGELKVETKEGEGSEFTIQLPVN